MDSQRQKRNRNFGCGAVVTWSVADAAQQTRVFSIAASRPGFPGAALAALHGSQSQQLLQCADGRGRREEGGRGWEGALTVDHPRVAACRVARGRGLRGVKRRLLARRGGGGVGSRGEGTHNNMAMNQSRTQCISGQLQVAKSDMGWHWSLSQCDMPGVGSVSGPK